MQTKHDPWKVTLAMVAGAIVLACGGGSTTDEPPGQTPASQACTIFRADVHLTAAGTPTNAAAAEAAADAQKKADTAARLNADYQPLLVMMTSVVNGGKDGRAVLAECRRFGF